jgi:HK97 family phage major capsid protein
MQLTAATHPCAIDLSRRDLARYSVLAAIRRATGEAKGPRRGFEEECSAAIAKKLGREPTVEGGLFLPLEIQHRDLTAGTGSAGGYLVQTENLGFVQILRNRSVCLELGVQRLPGLSGNATIPKQTGAATANWISDEAGTGASESNLVFGQMALTPKTVVTYTEISRQLQLQSSPAAEGLVMADLAAQAALAVDAAILQGTGASGQPTGIINTAGIGRFSGTSIALAAIIEAQSDVAASNALSTACAYVTTPAVAGLLMQRQRFASTDSPIWRGGVGAGEVLGFKAVSTPQMPASRILFGDFSTVVLAEWGVLEVSATGTPSAAGFMAGIVGVRALYTIDVGVRYAAAFSYSTAVS